MDVAVTHSPRSRATRAAFVALSIAVVVALVIVAFASCSTGSSPKPSAAGTTTTQRPKATKQVHPLKIGKVRIASVGPALQLSKRTRKAVLAAAQQYVDTGVYGPLDRGAVASGYTALFEAPIRAAASSVDRSALTEMPVGKADKYSAKATPVNLSGLFDGSGALVFLATNFTMHENVTTASGLVKVTRTVELTFVPKGKHWSVTAYRVVATRKKAATKTTTTARTRSGTTP